MKKIIRALTGAAATYNEPLNSDRLEGYLMTLKEYREDDVVHAIGETMKTCDRFPPPSKIITAIEAIGNRRMMIGMDEDDFELTEHDRYEVTELLAEFKKEMKWD